MNEELSAEIEKLKEQVKTLSDIMDMCVNRINETDRVIIEEILGPITKSFEEATKGYQFEDFKAKYGERLSPYSEILSKIENEDKDAVKEAFDAYNSYSDEQKANYPEETYIEELIVNLDNYVNNVRTALGLSSDTPVEIKSDNAGDIQVKAGEEDVTDKLEGAEEVLPTEPTDTPVAEEESVKEEVTDDKNDSKAFYEELLKNRSKFMR